MRVLFYRARAHHRRGRGALPTTRIAVACSCFGGAINWRLFGFSSSHRLQGEPMSELSHIDPRSVALLVMDYQVDPLTRFMTAALSADAIACVLDLIALARGAGMMVIHVVVAFRCGHPEVSPRNCGVDGVNSVGNSEPERTAGLVLVPGR